MQKLRLYEQTVLEIVKSGGDSICTEEDKEVCKAQYGEEHFEWACRRCDKNPKNRVKKNGK